MPEHRHHRHVDPPDSALCRSAAELLHRSAPAPLVAHCYRSYALGAALVADRGEAYDAEVLFVAAALHDLGLTTAYAHVDAPGFEHVGAAIAAELVREHRAGEERAALARDAVSLHLELMTAQDPRPEVAALHLGAAADVLGIGLDRLPDGLLDDALHRWPRAGFPAWLSEAMQTEAQRRPASTAGRYVRELGFLHLLAAAELPA
ncbi:HD domain-containing protein [Micromonospora sp. H33]|uniref:HD domain-containing protein n=1 Tax=Micromonospora sp. H33 TaxID=3452215 RepID=UPI003F8C4DCF